MATDPSISLGVNPPPAPPSPLGLVGSFADIQNRLNQNKLFQQTWAARQQAGQIMAGAPDLETGLSQVMSSPVAPFMGEFLNQTRQAMLAQTQQAGQMQEQNHSALQAITKGITGALADPSNLDTLIKANLQSLPPEVRNRPGVMDAVQSIRTSLLHDLPSDPAAAAAMFRQRAMAQLIGAGVSPADVQGASPTGTPTVMHLGNVDRTGTVAPGQFGGGFTPSTTGDLGIGAPAGYHDIGGTPTPLPAVPAGGGGSLALPKPAAPQPAAAAAAPLTPATSDGPVALAGDGKTLYDPATPKAPGLPSGQGAGALGINVLTPLQQEGAKGLLNKFNDEDAKQFETVSSSMQQFQHVNQAIDQLASNGGFLTPGSMGTTRLSIAKGLNTAATVLGIDKPFPNDTVASAEDLTKATKVMGTQLISNLLGQQREAAQTIQMSLQTVPGIENTPMGAKLIAGGLQAIAQRVIDERNFKARYLAENQGNLQNADVQFNRQHPASTYAAGVMKQYGIGAKGFNSPQDVAKAYQQGYLSRGDAGKILQDQFKIAPGTGQ